MIFPHYNDAARTLIRCKGRLVQSFGCYGHGTTTELWRTRAGLIRLAAIEPEGRIRMTRAARR